VKPPDDDAAARRRRLAALGDSLPVAPDDERGEGRGDDRDGPTTSTNRRDDDIRAEVPPHHG
jgi:hypothetical protein